MKLFPLFDKECELVGWVKLNDYIWDIDMNYVAFIHDGQAWSADNCNWLGPVKGLLCYDTLGKVVAWNPTESIIKVNSPNRPFIPVKPVIPISPVKPIAPVSPIKPIVFRSVWSSYSFNSWLSQ